MAHLDERGHEVLDPTPMEIPLGFKRPPTLQEQIRQLIRTEMSQNAKGKGMETFEEADDFEVGDDFDPSSPYELNFDQEIQARDPKGFKEETPNVRESKKGVGDSPKPDRKGKGTPTNSRDPEVNIAASDKDD